MEQENNIQNDTQDSMEDVVVNNDDLYNKKIITQPKPKINIDVEREHSIVSDILETSDSSKIDTSVLNSFLDVSRSRDQQYQIIDQMCQDSIPSAILELYSEDSTATNENKKVVWATADNPDVLKVVNYYIDSFQINKHIHKWASSMIKYGDVYLRLYKQSEYEDDPVFKQTQNTTSKNKKNALNEDINLHVSKDSDHFVSYVEMVDNPATMFELTRFGKTAGFIQTNVEAKNFLNNSSGSLMSTSYGNNFYQYSFKKNDINIYESIQFVHGSLDGNINRTTEEVQIILDNETDAEKVKSVTYKVRSGQSVFYNTFKIWRELSLLETSLLLNRLTKSSITRVIQVETGNTAKEETGQILQSLKQLIEQKAAFNPGSSFAEYNNPGPIENNIYIPTHDGKGAITTAQIGGDYDPKQLTDIDYFKNKFYGSMGIPKQYFGDTDDSTGFNGGTSLTIISSKYAKKIVKIQSVLINMITSLLNIVLVDRGLANYVNKFTIQMLAPMTQEDLDRRESEVNKLGVVRDTMDILGDIQDPKTRLKIEKILLSNIYNDSEIIELIQKEIEREEGENKESEKNEDRPERRSMSSRDTTPLGLDSSMLDTALDVNEEEQKAEIPELGEESTSLPTPGETGVDLVGVEDNI